MAGHQNEVSFHQANHVNYKREYIGSYHEARVRLNFHEQLISRKHRNLRAPWKNQDSIL